MAEWEWMPPLEGEDDASVPDSIDAAQGVPFDAAFDALVARGPMYFARDGSPMSLRDWSVRFGDLDYKIVARTEVAQGVRVSTVWLGIDHSFGTGPPLIFETMIFGGQLDETQERYATEAEAVAGHNTWVTVARYAQQMRDATDEAMSQLLDDERDPRDYDQDGEL